MKCGEVQFLLWNGTTSDEMKEHLQTCADCQKENIAMKHIFDKMHTIETPKPTRSLKPSMDIISKAVEQNRKRRTRKYSLMAASVTVLLGAASGLALQHNSMVEGQQKMQIANPAAVPFQVAPNSANADICNAVGQYLSSVWNTATVKHIVVTGFSGVIDQTNTLAQGEVTFDADLQTGAKMNIVQGTNKSRVVMRLVNGKWTVSDMEATVAPTSPEEAQNLWAKALMNRNGTLEYSLFSPELKASARADYEQHHWVVNGSSPWVQDANVTSSQRLKDGTYRMTVTMNLKTSGGPQGQQVANLYLRQYGDNWYIYKHEYTDISCNAVSSSIQLTNGTKLDSANPNGGNKGTWNGYTVALKTMGYEAQGDDSGVVASAGQMMLHSEGVQVQSQPAKLNLFQNTTTKQYEYWLIVDRPSQLQPNIKLAYALILSFPEGNEADAKQKLLELAKSWQLPSE
jgi:hypothetical protein